MPDIILKALHFAADKHRAQSRKDADGTPYINHPIALAHLLANYAGITDQNVIAAAILHDTIEDTETTEEEIERHFGSAVAALVLEVTDDRSLTWMERKRLEIEHAALISPRAKLIKLSDKISNVADTETNPPSAWSRQRRRDYLDFAEQIALGCRGINEALDADFVRVLASARAHIG